MDKDNVPDARERSRQLIGLLADENRLRAFAAVALGATSPEEVAGRAGLSPKATALALLRLREQGAVTGAGTGTGTGAGAGASAGAVTGTGTGTGTGSGSGAGGALAVSYGLLRELARPDRSARPAGTDVVSTFVRDGRLLRLPAQWTRKQQVLRHIAEQTFEPGVAYPERVVNERLRTWCEGSDEIDHVTLRRYLVDLHELRRSDGVYERAAAPAP
ncbi:DUF2087 domain-containing protein [Streptomyces actinomycinicus]|uniref:DUF2087 domain-containing protein n=1 Tax=Streptomyces actinomycinicus TaxID=1695166 RepID=A0A937JLW1_9ACTN|nr:DUF2087 domain-containing protein [Streptomyces actinomycinicus]MBL1080607.1 DUF2087 domain-containing protein [Streptomyces actinomycinicus]